MDPAAAGDSETNPGPNTDTGIQEAEFLHLANAIDPSMYMDVGIHLGFSFASLHQIKASHRPSIRDALLEVFVQWNARHGGRRKREELAEKLTGAGLDDLARKLLVGRQAVGVSPSIASTSGHHFQTISPCVPQDQLLCSGASLSEDQLQACKDDLRSFYRTYLCKIKEDPLDPSSLRPFEDVFTNLRMLAEDGSSWQHIDYEDLLNINVNGELPKRLIVQGEAGAGKTTLCSKIAWDWVNETHFQQFQLVLVVPLRECEKCSIGDIVKSYLGENNPVQASQLDSYFLYNQDKVFILFDGLDEFKEDILHSSSTSKPTASVSEGASTASLHATNIVKTLCSDQLKKCLVMVTSRPWKANQIRWDDKLRKAYSFIRVDGFSADNISVYIEKYFKNDVVRARNLIQFTKDNAIIAEYMTPFPIYTAMLCLMWRELEEERCRGIEQLQTFSQILMEMFLFLKDHHVLKSFPSLKDPARVNCLTEIDHLLKSVAKIAFDGLMHKDIVFEENDFHHCQDAMVTACKIGVLTTEERLTPRVQWRRGGQSRLKTMVYFPHKLFQEYMAGLHLAELHKSDRKEYHQVVSHMLLRKEEFRYPLYFATAFDKRVGLDIVTNMIRFPFEFQQRMDFVIDVAFECHDKEVAELVRRRIPQMKLNISTPHTLAGYVFLKPSLGDLVVTELELTQGLAEALSTTFTKEVHLNSCSITNDFFAVLTTKGKNVNVPFLSLRGMTLNDSASSDLASCLRGLSNLTHLELASMDLKVPFFKVPCSVSEAAAFKVQSLSLHGMDFTSDSASRDLAVWLCSLSQLRCLKLVGIEVEENFFMMLCSMAESLKLQSLTLRRMLAFSCVSKYLAILVSLLPRLTHLELQMMDLQDKFYTMLHSKALSVKIQSLSIMGMKFSDKASKSLASCICVMPHLTSLTLEDAYKHGGEGNYLHWSFFQTLEESVASFKGCLPNISKGNFKFNGVDYSEKGAFLEAMKCDKNVRWKEMEFLRPYSVCTDDEGLPEEEEEAEEVEEGDETTRENEEEEEDGSGGKEKETSVSDSACRTASSVDLTHDVPQSKKARYDHL